VNELGPPDFKSNERFEKTRTVRLKLPSELYAFDLRRGTALGPRREIEITLNPYEPALFAFSPVGFAPLRLTAPARLRRGDVARIGISLDLPSPAAVHVFHVEVTDPSGKLRHEYSGNLPAPLGRTSKALASALNDAAGKWTIRVRDALSGQQRSAEIEFY
jgi:hypothetical protein